MGNWGLIRRDLTELSTIKGKDPTTWRPWTGENWSILGMWSTEEVLSVKVSLDEYYYGRAWSLCIYLCSTYV